MAAGPPLVKNGALDPTHLSMLVGLDPLAGYQVLQAASVGLDASGNPYGTLVGVGGGGGATGTVLETLTPTVYGAGTFTGATLNALNYGHVVLYAGVSASSGTTPNLAIEIDGQLPTTPGLWPFQLANNALTGPGTLKLEVGPGTATFLAMIPNFVRVKWIITGTTPSFTLEYAFYGKP